MVIESIKIALVIFIVGLTLGSFITKKYFTKSNSSLGSTIESIMISRNIEEIYELSKILGEIVNKLNQSGEKLIDKTQKAQDIEQSIDLSKYDLTDLENIDISKFR